MPRSFLITNRRYRTALARDDDVTDDVDDVTCSPSSSPYSRDDCSQDSVSPPLCGQDLLSPPDKPHLIRLHQPLTPYNRLDHLVSPPASGDVLTYWDSCRQPFPFFDHLLPELLRRVTASVSVPDSGSLVEGSAAGASTGDVFACTDCSKRYSSASNLARHRVTHQRSSSSSSTSTAAAAAAADRRVTRQCPHCAKVYSSIPAYSMHVRTHTQGCACPHCGKRFSRPWLLQGHVRTHTGERPFRCPQCSKTFADKSNLRAHVQTHSAHKPYSCARCGKAFALKSYLYKHEESSCMRAVATGGATTPEYRLKHSQLVPSSMLPLTSAFIGRSS